MKTLICYTSKNGTTERYMRWLADDLQADIRTFGEIPRNYDFSGYDTVVVSSGTYIGFMKLTKFLKKRWNVLRFKKVVAVAVGAAPADDPWSIKSYERIPTEIRDGISYIKIVGEEPEKSRPTDYESPVEHANLEPVMALIVD